MNKDLLIKETCTKGMRITLGDNWRESLNKCIDIVTNLGFQEIRLPIIQEYSIFEGKVGEENNNMMYRFKDRGGRDLCLAPEYSGVVMQLANTTFKYTKNVLLFYVAECFRGENPQKGRFRQFTQFGVEILNPKEDFDPNTLIELAIKLCKTIRPELEYQINTDVTRGLDYYLGGKGFEIRTSDNFQIVGGGAYPGGIGFAIGFDRLLSI